MPPRGEASPHLLPARDLPRTDTPNLLTCAATQDEVAARAIRHSSWKPCFSDESMK